MSDIDLDEEEFLLADGKRLTEARARRIASEALAARYGPPPPGEPCAHHVNVADCVEHEWVPGQVDLCEFICPVCGVFDLPEGW